MSEIEMFQQVFSRINKDFAYTGLERRDLTEFNFPEGYEEIVLHGDYAGATFRFKHGVLEQILVQG